MGVPTGRPGGSFLWPHRVTWWRRGGCRLALGKAGAQEGWEGVCTPECSAPVLLCGLGGDACVLRDLVHGGQEAPGNVLLCGAHRHQRPGARLGSGGLPGWSLEHPQRKTSHRVCTQRGCTVPSTGLNSHWPVRGDPSEVSEDPRVQGTSLEPQQPVP